MSIRSTEDAVHSAVVFAAVIAAGVAFEAGYVSLFEAGVAVLGISFVSLVVGTAVLVRRRGNEHGQ